LGIWSFGVCEEFGGQQLFFDTVLGFVELIMYGSEIMRPKVYMPRNKSPLVDTKSTITD
jgi:hypothetical protein